MRRTFNAKHTDKSDEVLLDTFQSSGDMAALGILFDRYIELVYGLCLKYFKNREKAQDAVMGIFEELVRKLPHHEVRTFKSWLFVLSRNYCLMQLRKKDRTSELSPHLMQSENSAHPTPDHLEVELREQALLNCIEKLPEKQKACIRQFYFENKSYQAIAENRGEALGKIRSYIQNGRRNLRICMEKFQNTKKTDRSV